jgi:hypothetical protein
MRIVQTIAMQKVVGSSPISRFRKPCTSQGLLVDGASVTPPGSAQARRRG